MDTERLDQIKNTLKHELDSLQRTREELCMQASLARADLRTEWQHLESRLRLAQEEFGRLSEHTKAAGREIEARTRSLIQEIKAGYERLRHTT